MQAPHPEQSYLKINFGQTRASESPVDLQLTLDLFSSQQQGIRHQLVAQYKTDIPQTCFAIQFLVESGLAQATAQRLEKLSKQQVSDSQEPKDVYSFHHFENRVLCLLNSPEYVQLIKSNEEYFAQLKSEASTQSHAISLRIMSHNDLKTIGDKWKEFGRLAWLQSTHFSFAFVKTDLVSKFLIILFQQILDVNSFSSGLRSFKKLNLEVNFAGAEYLREFPKVKAGGYLAAQQHQKTEIVSIFEEAGAQKAKLYGFNPILYLKGDLLATGLKHHLQVAFK